MKASSPIFHRDHEEVSSLLTRILDTSDNHKRGELFREMMSKLLAHAKAEQKILYRKLEKSRDSDARKFAFEGDVEHEVVESQLQQLARARKKDSEQWTARLTFLQEAVEKHVKEEESTGVRQRRAGKTWRAVPAREGKDAGSGLSELFYCNCCWQELILQVQRLAVTVLMLDQFNAGTAKLLCNTIFAVATQ